MLNREQQATQSRRVISAFPGTWKNNGRVSAANEIEV